MRRSDTLESISKKEFKTHICGPQQNEGRLSVSACVRYGVEA